MLQGYKRPNRAKQMDEEIKAEKQKAK